MLMGDDLQFLHLNWLRQEDSKGKEMWNT